MKRRLRLAYRKPKWDKAVQITQYCFMVVTVIAFILFSEFEFWGEQYKPSRELRNYVFNLFGIMDPDKRYEYSIAVPPRDGSKSESK
ncbi:hypothetical protein XA68_17856 [Ophiocordyceps unilateralis]|uniref:Uncharacterized protein n=1 Tax=Ophiocordyceps unilateralis TaxID=268505 RepID=A0A2A9P3V4_OPHUN|nr:hypothetical protein XA68_17856 [Ophiocordyceps unilateralis]